MALRHLRFPHWTLARSIVETSASSWHILGQAIAMIDIAEHFYTLTEAADLLGATASPFGAGLGWAGWKLNEWGASCLSKNARLMSEGAKGTGSRLEAVLLYKSQQALTTKLSLFRA